MNRYTAFTILILSFSAHADTVGHWRFAEDSAAAGGQISSAENFASPGALDASVANGTPLYSDDVPAAEIYDPVSDTTYPNLFSLDASGSFANFSTDNSTVLDSSFTVEFFIKMIGEPASYESILDRVEALDLSWKIDFDHAFSPSFGRIRTRFDTPAGGISDGVDENGVDENWNFVAGPLGGASAAKLYIDTGAKDAAGVDVGPQNTGNPNDYIYDATSVNPNEVDVSLQGDGLNDTPKWHHVALSFDETTGEIRIYFDYALAQSRILSDSEANGYTHPFAGLRFGKLSGSENGLLLDEIRYSDEILTTRQFLREPATGGGNVTAYWRMEGEGDESEDGDDLFDVSNEVSALHPANATGNPKYSADVVASNIFDPISNATYVNNFSMDVSAPNSRLNVTSDEAFNTSFSLEFFMKLSGEPGGYHAFLRRTEMNDLRWQIDFDHAALGGFGRLRARFDTPGANGPDGVNEVDVDENINFVLGPQGGVNIPNALRLWLDTDAGDGMVASYDDPADWSLDGDGINDNNVWHHVAITLDQETGELNFYYDYELLQTRTLSDSLMDGYTHPDGNLQLGKLTNSDYGLFIDEIRYSGEVLPPFQFLQAITVLPKELQITAIIHDAATPGATVTWNTISGRKYSLDASNDLLSWFELTEEEVADGETMSYTDTDLLDGSEKLFYRVREIE